MPSHTHNLISGLLPTTEIQFVLKHHDVEYHFIIRVANTNIDVCFGRSEMDDFEFALERHRNTNYFHTLEKRIKFQIYILLEGLLPDFDISSEILNEKGEWLKNYSVDVAFDKWFCKILYEGLKLLSNSLNMTLSGTNVELDEINADKKLTDELIKYYDDNGHFTSLGAKTQSLSFLKDAAVCVIIEQENRKKETTIPNPQS